MFVDFGAHLLNIQDFLHNWPTRSCTPASLLTLTHSQKSIDIVFGAINDDCINHKKSIISTYRMIHIRITYLRACGSCQCVFNWRGWFWSLFLQCFFLAFVFLWFRQSSSWWCDWQLPWLLCFTWWPKKCKWLNTII